MERLGLLGPDLLWLELPSEWLNRLEGVNNFIFRVESDASGSVVEVSGKLTAKGKVRLTGDISGLEAGLCYARVFDEGPEELGAFPLMICLTEGDRQLTEHWSRAMQQLQEAEVAIENGREGATDLLLAAGASFVLAEEPEAGVQCWWRLAGLIAHERQGHAVGGEGLIAADNLTEQVAAITRYLFRVGCNSIGQDLVNRAQEVFEPLPAVEIWLSTARICAAGDDLSTLDRTFAHDRSEAIRILGRGSVEELAHEFGV